MSYQSIDLQMSIPRTPEASGVQSQIIHKPVAEQHKLADDASKQTEIVRHKNTNVEEASGLNVQDGQGRSHGRHSSKKRERKRKPEQAQQLSAHPYKGKHIDLSL
ncbi:hypothetical protein AB6A23_11635 [Paenibacillus tarimensis]